MEYGEYVSRFWAFRPGEHHLVAVYLVPLLRELFGRYPIYVNPDGMKAIQGDLVFRFGRKTLGIEVKLQKIQLTKTQFQAEYMPDHLLCFDRDGIGFARWAAFHSEYLAAMEDLKASRSRKYETYGPTLRLDDLRSITRTDHAGLVGELKRIRAGYPD